MDLLVDLSAGSETSNCPPLRGRVDQRYGLLDLSPADQAKTDYDSALVLKQQALHQLAEECQSPEDPARYAQEHDAPTYWSWPELTQFWKNMA